MLLLFRESSSGSRASVHGRFPFPNNTDSGIEDTHVHHFPCGWTEAIGLGISSITEFNMIAFVIFFNFVYLTKGHNCLENKKDEKEEE